MSSWRIVSKYRNYSNQRNGMNRENKCECEWKNSSEGHSALVEKYLMFTQKKKKKNLLDFQRWHTRTQQRIMCKIPFIFIIALMLFRCAMVKNVFNTFFFSSSLLFFFFCDNHEWKIAVGWLIISLETWNSSWREFMNLYLVWKFFTLSSTSSETRWISFPSFCHHQRRAAVEQKPSNNASSSCSL